MTITNKATITVDKKEAFQKIEGFGVNLNAKYWNDGELKPVIDYFIDDLGCTMFRVDCYGKANWVDPDNRLDKSCLNRDFFDKIYKTREFIYMKELCLYLNSKGIEPYVTVSGIAPNFMCGEDGITLRDYKSYAVMLADYAKWLYNEGVNYHLFGPFNETDLGPPEGPVVSHDDFISATKAVIEELDKLGMTDLMLVLPEQAGIGLGFFTKLAEHDDIKKRMAICAMHCYHDFHVTDFVDFCNENFPNAKKFMSEFGDLDQNCEAEDAIAFTCARRLMRVLKDGVNGAMSWDAFDNYHDHDARWTTFGLLKNSWDYYIPKKRCYALKHFYRFIKPGMVRIAGSCTNPDIEIAAFAEPDGEGLTVVGINSTNEGYYLDLNLGYNDSNSMNYLQFRTYRTAEYENCADISTKIIKLKNHAGVGCELMALPHSIFTITNVK